MKKLMAYEETIQNFINTHRPTTKKNLTKERTEKFIEAAKSLGKPFAELFPRKQKNVTKQILLKTAQTGITKISLKTLAIKSECGETTVKETVRKIKKFNEIFVGRMKTSDANHGKYVFVDRRHKNFKEILSSVFKYSTDEINELTASLNDCNNDFENGSKKLVVKPVKSTFAARKTVYKGIKVFKSFKSLKHTIHTINNTNARTHACINYDEKEINNENKKMTVEEQNLFIENYAKNPNQIRFYNEIQSLKDVLSPCILNRSHVIALRLGDNANATKVEQGISILKSISEREGGHESTIDGPITDQNIVAIFTGALEKRKSYKTIPESKLVVAVKKALESKKIAALTNRMNETKEKIVETVKTLRHPLAEKLFEEVDIEEMPF